MIPFFQVALGGAIGAVMRYGLGLCLASAWGTFIVNVLGCFLIGILFVVLPSRGLVSVQPLLITGVLGGFTTFSAFSLDTLKMIEAGTVGPAVIYAISTLIGCLIAVMAGAMLARGLM